MKFDRAWRRAQRDRLKKKRATYWDWDRNKSPALVGKLINTPKMCGCWMCSNARKVFGKPISQIRAEQIDPEMFNIKNED